MFRIAQLESLPESGTLGISPVTFSESSKKSLDTFTQKEWVHTLSSLLKLFMRIPRAVLSIVATFFSPERPLAMWAWPD